MTDPAIPNANDPIGVGINAMVAARPSILPHVDTGRYANVLIGWRAQAAMLIARIADEVRSSRLATAQGDALRALVASEFDIQTNGDGRSTAIGLVNASRSGTGAGTIPSGTRWRRVPNPNLSPPVKEATYVTTEDVFVQTGMTSGILLPSRCTQDGITGNINPDDGTYTNTVTTPYQWIDPVFDPTLTFFAVSMGGGAEITVDDDLRRAARAMAQGRYAPVTSALLAFAYRGQGVRRAAAIEDTSTGITRMIVADGSRGGSSLWASRVRQGLEDAPAIGFGCRVQVYPATIGWVAVTATVVLRDSRFQNFTSDISNAIRAALTSYFTDRDDFYAYKTPAVRAVISRADPRILTCTSAVVTTATGFSQIDPPPYQPGNPPINVFWTLASRGLSVTYQNPS